MKTTNEQALQNWREHHRMRAWEIHQQSYSPREVADALDMSQSAISQRISRAKAGGLEALRHHNSPGRRSYVHYKDMADPTNERTTAVQRLSARLHLIKACFASLGNDEKTSRMSGIERSRDSHVRVQK